jgi:hypothetical protein
VRGFLNETRSPSDTTGGRFELIAELQATKSRASKRFLLWAPQR